MIKPAVWPLSPVSNTIKKSAFCRWETGTAPLIGTFAIWHLEGLDHGYDTRRLDCSLVRSLADMALHRFRQGAVRPLLDRGLVVVGNEPYPDPVFGRPSDRRASAAVL